MEVVKLLEGADPRNKLARRAALQLMGDEPRTPAPAPLMPPPPPRNQQLANRETQALASMPPPPPPSSQTSPTRSSLTSFLGEAASNAASSISEAATSLLRTPSVEARQVRTASEDQQNDRETRVRRRVDEFIKREGDSLKRSASTPSLSQRDITESADSSPKSPPRPVLSASCAMLQQLNITASQARVKLGLDLGGSLTKLVIATPLEDTDTPTTPRTNKPHLRVACDVNGVRTRLQFVSAATDELEEVLAALGCSDNEDEDEERRSFNRASRRIVAAGGGAHKLRRTFRSALGIEFKAFPEMQSVVDGLLLLHELECAGRGLHGVGRRGPRDRHRPKVRRAGSLAPAVATSAISERRQRRLVFGREQGGLHARRRHGFRRGVVPGFGAGADFGHDL